MGAVRLVCGLAAAIVLALSLAVHAAASDGIDVEAVTASVWWLHGASMLVFALALVVTLRLAGGRSRSGEIFRLVPAWALALIVLALVYTLANFVWLTGATGAGVPIVGGGTFAFNDHGRIHEVSETAFHAERAATVRLYSALWLYLSLIATLYLALARRVAD